MGSYTQVQWLKEAIQICMDALTFADKAELNVQFGRLEYIYGGFTKEEQGYIHKFLREQSEVNDSLYILSFMVSFTKIPEFWEDVAYNILKGDFDGFTGSMLETQFVKCPNTSYTQMRSIHRKNVLSFDREIGTGFSYIPVEKRNKNRILIITEQLLSSLHAPTAVTLRFAYVLQEKLGYEVMIFTCPSDRILPVGLWIITYGYYGKSEGYKQINYKDTAIDTYGFPMASASYESYKKMMDLVYEWNPLFVLSMGVNNPIADLPQKFTTVASMAMAIEAPVSEASILFRYIPRTEEWETEYKRELQPHQKQVFMEEKLPVVMEKTGRTYTCRELGLPENRFLIAIVGNRLDTEVTEEFAVVMKQIVQKSAQMDFVIIGKVEKIQIYFEDEIYKGRIHYLGYCKDLLGTYNALDLYLNPRRLGGGWSSAIALAAGLPVVTLPECDVAYNVGMDFVVSDYTEMVDVVLRYATDAVFYEERKQQAFKVAEKSGDDKMVDYVTKMVDKVREVIEND